MFDWFFEFIGVVIKVFSYALTYVLSIELGEIPLNIAYFGIICLFGYCSSMILIGLPITIWEEITKKKINYEVQQKIIFRASVFIIIAFLFYLSYLAVNSTS